jgi:hypothetical protein
MKISLNDVVVAFLLATSLSLVVIPQPKPFPHHGTASVRTLRQWSRSPRRGGAG